ncbi:MAG: hypothetical protein NTV39_01390 [Candidatus Saccharibacteria bacterium]|nr:hypothetical protein [Candidatus Saccharibacteria bacterium]
MVKKKKIENNKKLIYAILLGALFLIALISVVSIARFVTISNNSQTVAVSDKPAADKLKQKGIDEMQTKPKQAIQMLETAEKQYQYVVDHSDDQATRDAAQNEIVDCEALIWLLTH